MNVLALSGSLRAQSINSAFCRAAARLAPASTRVSVYAHLGELPLFNPDLEELPPPPVLEYRAAVGGADVVLIASPEYAHGISGVLKNALDWLVSHEATVAKPVVLVNTSPRAHHALEALREILTTMSVSIIDEASVSIALLGTHTTEKAMLAAPEVQRSIQKMFTAMERHFSGHSETGPVFPLA